MSKSITYVGAGTFAAAAGAINNVSFNAGTQTGDLIFLLIHTTNNATTSPATGWLEVGNQANQAVGTADAQQSVRLSVYYKWASVPEATLNLIDFGNLNAAQTFTFRYVNRNNPFIATASGAVLTSTANPTLPAVTTTVPDSTIFFAMAVGRDLGTPAGTGNFTGFTNANLTTITERADESSALQTGGGLAAWTAVSTTRQNIGTSTATKNTAWSDSVGYLTIALRPAARRFSIT